MIEFNNLGHAHQIAAAAPTVFNPMGDQCISRSINGRFMGGAIVSDYTGKGGSCCMHVAGPEQRWLCRDLLWVVFDYAFGQLGCKKVFVQVSSKNENSLQFTKRLGFKTVACIPGAFPDADMYIKGLDASECRWTKIKPRGLVRGVNG